MTGPSWPASQPAWFLDQRRPRDRTRSTATPRSDFSIGGFSTNGDPVTSRSTATPRSDFFRSDGFVAGFSTGLVSRSTFVSIDLRFDRPPSRSTLDRRRLLDDGGRGGGPLPASDSGFRPRIRDFLQPAASGPLVSTGGDPAMRFLSIDGDPAVRLLLTAAACFSWPQRRVSLSIGGDLVKTTAADFRFFRPRMSSENKILIQLSGNLHHRPEGVH